MNREMVIKAAEICLRYIDDGNCPVECPYFDLCTKYEKRVVFQPLIRDALALLKEQELPTELKQKMWNALYAEEDEYEKKFVGKEEHLNWFTVYRPWLQKGFDIAINTIADWEGR